jgi:hypothetical protein
MELKMMIGFDTLPSLIGGIIAMSSGIGLILYALLTYG